MKEFGLREVLFCFQGIDGPINYQHVIIIYCFFFFYKSQNLIFFLSATILATTNSLLILNILIYFLVSDFTTLYLQAYNTLPIFLLRKTSHIHPTKQKKTKTLEKVSLFNQATMESSQNHKDQEHYIKN
jgi:hypothetical protein